MASSTVAHPQDELEARLLDHLDRKEVRFVASTVEELARVTVAIDQEVASFVAFFEAEVEAEAAEHGDRALLFGRPATELRATVHHWEASGTLRYMLAGEVGEELGMTRTGDTYAW